MTAPFLAIAVMVLLAVGRPCPASARGEDRPGRPHPELAASAAAVADGPAAAALIAVNHASSEDLQRLPGIGPRKAAALVEARDRRPFKRPSDLRRVKGFGARTIQRLAPLLSFE